MSIYNDILKALGSDNTNRDKDIGLISEVLVYLQKSIPNKFGANEEIVRYYHPENETEPVSDSSIAILEQEVDHYCLYMGVSVGGIEFVTPLYAIVDSDDKVILTNRGVNGCYSLPGDSELDTFCQDLRMEILSTINLHRKNIATKQRIFTDHVDIE